MEYVYIVLLLAFGAVMVIKPDLLWKLDHLFTVKNGEPTDFYLAFTRICGVVLILIAFFFGATAIARVVFG